VAGENGRQEGAQKVAFRWRVGADLVQRAICDPTVEQSGLLQGDDRPSQVCPAERPASTMTALASVAQRKGQEL
jgi:hypothetical protein